MHETRINTHEPTTITPTSLRMFILIAPTTGSLYSSLRSGQAEPCFEQLTLADQVFSKMSPEFRVCTVLE